MLRSIVARVQSVFAWWFADIQKRKSFAGKAASLLIGLFVLCCACSFGYAAVRGTGQAIGLVATNTPSPQPTSTPAPTNIPEPIAPPPTNIPEPTAILPTPIPTDTPTVGPTQPPLPTATPAPPTEPPTVAEQVRAAVEAVLTKSNRSMPRVTTAVADPDQKNPQIYIRWTINDNITEGFIKTGARLDAKAILKAVNDLGLPYSAILIEGTFPLVDKLGNSKEEIVVHALYKQSTIAQINWPNFLTKNVYEVADEVTIHPAFQE